LLHVYAVELIIYLYTEILSARPKFKLTNKGEIHLEKSIAIQKNPKNLLKFLIPSLIGILLFMTPVLYNGEITIPIALFSGLILDYLSSALPGIMTSFICLSFIGSLFTILLKPKAVISRPYWNTLLNITPSWFLIRGFGALFALSTYFKIGSEWIWSGNTGGLLLNDLIPILFAVFLLAGLFLPLLLNYGLLEFFGVLLTKIMRPIFKLPGRSSIDCITSWLGDGTIGVLLTSKQYEEGHYTAREAAVIGTTFSAVSITFSLVVISQVNLGHLFLPFYLTVLLAGVVAAILVPRIPPLSRKPNTYINGNGVAEKELIPSGYTPISWGLEKAIEKAASSNGVKSFFKEGSQNVIDMWIGVTPVVMAMGTIALILAEYTPVFTWLGIPFIPFLKLLQVPHAAEASTALVVGFADMFLPSVIISSLENDMTRFIIACASVTQLIYMSEVGGLLLGSKIPVKLWELVVIFIQRTIITLPVIVLMANIIF